MNDYSGARFRAAVESQGTSSDPIYQMVLKELNNCQNKGSLLDVGCGTGELLKTLHDQDCRFQTAGIDILEQSESFPARARYFRHNLDQPFDEVFEGETFDIVTCIEVIEHLENPRQLFAGLARLIKPGGTLILTTPNQESLRSIVSLLFYGHHVAFRDQSYPAHITALLRKDLSRLCSEQNFDEPDFIYSNHGHIPALTSLTWQQISAGRLRGRLFSDNLGIITKKKSV